MPKFTIERQYLVPEFQHVTVEADTPEAAMQLAMDSDDWEGSKTDYESARPHYITAAWTGEAAHQPGVASLPIPPRFRDWSQEQAGRFSAYDTQLILDALDIVSPDTDEACDRRDSLILDIREASGPKEVA